MFRLATVTTLPKSSTSDCSVALSLDQRVVETPSMAYFGANEAACCDDAVASAMGSGCGMQLAVSAPWTPSAAPSDSGPQAGRTRVRASAEREDKRAMCFTVDLFR